MSIKSILQICILVLTATLLAACPSSDSSDSSQSSSGDNNNDNNGNDNNVSNVVPVAAAGADQTVDVGVTVTLDASASSDSDGNITSYSWSQTAGTDVSINNPDSELATFVVPESASDSNLSFELTVVDDDNASASDSLVVVVSNTDDDNNDTDPNPDDNSEPVANAGDDQRVNEGAVVELNASASSAGGGTIATYQWTQIDGAAVDLNNSTSAQAFFEAPQVDSEANFIFRLTVTNTNGAQSLDSTIITVLNNEAPTASASAEAQAYEGTTVTLDGSASSDSDGSIATYLWEQTAGPTASIANPAAQSTTFTAPAVEEHTALAFLLTVTDNDGAQSTDEINITIIYNTPPTANVGANQEVNEIQLVQLDGSASSDAEGSSLTYLWQQVDSSGYSVTLNDANSSNPSFTTPEVAADTNLSFQLTVTDSLGKSGDANVTISIVYHIPPTANAGANQEVNEIELVQLDGSASSDSEGSSLTYLWQQVDSSDYSISLSDAYSSNPSFTTPQVPADTDLIFQLTVTNSLGKSSDANVTISIVYNTPPSANAGSNAQVNENAVVQLDGSASVDSEDSNLTYFWQQTDISDYSVTLSDANSVNPTFNSPEVAANTNLSFQLSVTDSLGKNSRDDVTISVIYNNPPVASVGNDQQVSEGDSVQLYGAGSSDIEDISLSYLWQQVDSSDYSVTLSDANSANPSFTAPNPVAADTNLSFQLTVTDSLGKSSDANSTVSVIFNNPPIARAGDDQGVEEGAAVELDGSASSDSEGSDLIYSWQQVDSSGYFVSLNNADTAQPSFTAPQPIASDTVLTFQLTVTDSFGKSGDDNVTVSVFDSNPPIANAGADQSVIEGETVELNGSVANDIEGLSIAYFWQQVDSSGYSVTLSDANIANPSFATPELSASTDLIFQLTATDSLGKSGEDNVTISIAYNNPPIADAGANARANENESVQLDGSASSDIENSSLTYLWEQIDNSGYAVTLSDANISNPTFITPEVAANTNLSFQLSVTDSLGKSSNDNVTVSVIYNNPPVAIVGDDQSVDEGASVELYGSASSDIEGSGLSYIWQQVDSSGYAISLSDANSATPSFTAPNPVAADTDLVFQLTVTDDLGKSSDANSTVRVIYNTPPVASAGADQSVNEGAIVQLDGSASEDSDGSIASYSWQQVDSSGYAITLSDVNSATPSFTAPTPIAADTNLTFQLTVTDDFGKSSDANVTITVIYNTPPTANAGANQSGYEGESVQLDASASSDSDGTVDSYFWQQVDSSGYSAYLSNPNLSDPTFTAPEIAIDEANLTFQLTVTDNLGKTDDATVTITVLNNVPPAVSVSTNADDPTQVNEGVTIQLDGSASSDVEGSNLAYFWQQVDSSGYSVTLSDNQVAQPTFITPVVTADTTLIFQLTVTDSLGKSSDANASISVIYNSPPIARAGNDQSLYEGESIQLDGSASSDVEDDASSLSYLWQQVDGSEYSVTLIDPETARPSFTTPQVPVDTNLVFQLTVTDSLGKSSEASVTITVFDNAPPVADAGANQSVYESTSVQLDGSASADSDGSIAAYAWQQIDSSGYSVSLSDATSAQASFTAPAVAADAELTFELTVTDNDGVQGSATVVVSVIYNEPPVANAGTDQSVFEGDSVELGGSASSDSDGSIASYAWQQVDSSGYSISLSGANTAEPTFTVPVVAADTDLIFQLTVIDNLGKSSDANVTISVIYNNPPVANAGADKQVNEGASVQLNASSSSDSDGNIVSYAWQQIDNSGYSISLSDADSANASFTAPDPVVADTDLIFQLTVTDSLGKSSQANTTITVIYNEPPVANAGDNQPVYEGDKVELDGSASSDSEDAASALDYLWQQVDSSGYSVAISDANRANASFTAPDPVSASGANLTFQLTVTDSLGKSSDANTTVTVIYNNPPVADAGSDQSVYEGATVELDGSASSDSDGTIASYSWQQVDSSGHSLTLTNPESAQPSFTTPKVSADTNLILQLTVTDDRGKSSDANLTITVLNNTLPRADAGVDQDTFAGEVVILDASGSSDNENNIVAYLWDQTDGPVVSIANANSETASFIAPVVSSDTELSFDLRVTDSANATSASDTVVITVIDNDPPVADPGTDQQIQENVLFQLDAEGSSDSDGYIASYFWQQVDSSGYSITLTDPEVAAPIFTTPLVAADTDLIFQLTVTDDRGQSVDANVTITITYSPPPTANAGADQVVNQSETIQLNGSNSASAESSIASYSWQQVDNSGYSVTLTDPETAQPTFITPQVAADTELIFQLTVTDSIGKSGTDTVSITVTTTDNTPPTAHAGEDQEVTEGDLVQLDGSASSDSDGSIVSYSWQQIDDSGYSVTLTDPETAQPSFDTSEQRLFADTELIFQLTVTDNIGRSSTDTVSITVLTTYNYLPTANAGADQLVNQEQLVQLDGSASSDSDGSIVSYSWQQVDNSGYAVTLTDPETARPTFISPVVAADTDLIFELTVTDNIGDSRTDTVTISVTLTDLSNTPPVANAGGDRSANQNQLIQLDGSASSDSDGSIESYFWQQIDSSGYTVTLDDANSATPSFTTPDQLQADINLTFQLRVTDDSGATDTDTATITVAAAQIEPLIADAGAEQEVNPGASVQLSGSALSASDANIESYFWQQIDASGYLITLSDANIARPTFTAPVVSEDTALVFRLTVTDNLGYTATDTVTITVDVDNSSADNTPPVAYAGDDQTVSENVQVQLDSSGSNDPDGRIENRKWQQIDDSGYSVVLDASGAVQPKFLSPRVAAETELIFQVTITDDQGATDVDSVVITVTYSAGPTADAGADQEVDEGEVVQLDGTASSEGSGSGVTPYWQQIDTSGHVVRLSDVNSDRPTFTAPSQLNADTDLTFQLIVVDNATGKDSVPDTVTITVNDTIQFQADAGIDNAQSAGTIAHLRSSNTDASSYLWEQITSYAIVIDRADTSHASFQIPEDLEIGATLSFRLTVTNADQTTTDTDTTSITIADPGNLKWHFSTGTILIPDDEDIVNANTSPTIGPDGTVYFGSYDHQFYALNPEDGSVKWSFDAEGPLRSPAIVGADGTVYLAVSQYPYTQSVSDPETGENFSDNYLYAVSPPTGSNELGVLKWRRLMTSYTSSHFVPEDSVAISADGTLYLGGKGGDGELLYALDPEDGSTKWTFVDSDDVDVDVNRVSNHTPAISPDGTIYMSGYRSVDGFTESFFYAINPPSEAGGNTGELLWRYRPPDESVRYAGDETHNGSFKFSNPAIGADGIIYITNSEHSIYAFNPSDGSRKWRSTGSDGVVSSSNTDIFQSSGAVAADGTIYFGGVNGNDMLYALKPTDGTRKWAYDVRDEDTFAGDLHHVKSGAVLGADGRTYFASDEKKVYALDSNDTDSELVWSYALDDKPSYSTSVIASDGTLFITDSTGMYAIHTSAAGLAADSPWPRSRNNNRGTSRANLAPTASASASQLIVNPGMTVNLDSAASTDPDGVIIDYYWRETSGFDISIQDNNSAQASFVVPSPAANSILSIELTVTDDHGATTTTTLSIDIEI